MHNFWIYVCLCNWLKVMKGVVVIQACVNCTIIWVFLFGPGESHLGSWIDPNQALD